MLYAAATTPANSVWFTNDATIFGILMVILGFVFYTASRPDGFWKKFYGVVPSVLLCYFLPSLLTTFGLVDSRRGASSTSSRRATCYRRASCC